MNDVTVGSDVFVRQINSWGDISVSPAKVLGVADENERPEIKGKQIIDTVVFNADGSTSALTTGAHTDDDPLGWYDNYDEAANAIVPLDEQEQLIVDLRRQLDESRAQQAGTPVQSPQDREIAQLRAELAAQNPPPAEPAPIRVAEPVTTQPTFAAPGEPVNAEAPTEPAGTDAFPGE